MQGCLTAVCLLSAGIATSVVVTTWGGYSRCVEELLAMIYPLHFDAGIIRAVAWCSNCPAQAKAKLTCSALHKNKADPEEGGGMQDQASLLIIHSDFT